MTLPYALRQLGLPKAAKAARLTFSKPAQSRRIRGTVKVYSDGREVCQDTRAGRAEYKHRTEQMYVRDEAICCICLLPIASLEEATTEHKGKRGMGGGLRDDRIEKNGVAHGWCNSELGSVRLSGPAADICLDCNSADCHCLAYVAEGGAL